MLAPPDDTVAGTGQAAAISYLNALRTAVAGRQVLVLPYSDPDAVAMVRAGLTRKLGELVTKGRSVAADILALRPATGPDGPGLITTMAMPEGGAVDDATLAILSNNGMTQALLAPQSMRHSGSAIGAVTVDERGSGGRTVAAAVTDSPLLAAVNNLINKGTTTGLAVRLNTVAALLAGSSIDGSGTPLIIAPSSRWTPNVAGLQTLTRLLAQLETGAAVLGTPLPVIAGTAVRPALLSYPDKSARAELDPGYLAAAQRTSGWLAGVRSSLARSRGELTPDPADLLTPLSTALLTTTSYGLRGDRRNGQRILQTVDATLGQLRDKVTISSGTSYTLAGSTSPLLISVRNDLPYVVTVRVVIRNGQSVGMSATDPGPLSIPAGQSRQFKIATKVVKAGRFQIGAQLVTATGSNWSEATTITVRSSAYGTITIILIIVAGGALLLMVMIRIIQRIRGRGGNAWGGNEPGPDGPPGGPYPTDGPHPGNPSGPGTSTLDPENPASNSMSTAAPSVADKKEGTR